MNNERLDSVGIAENELTVDHAKKKRRIVMLMLAYSALLGVIACFLPEDDTPLDILLSLPQLLLGIMWCFEDAAERGRQIGSMTRILLVLVFIVGLPVYLFQTRGVGAFKALLLAAALFGALVACMWVAAAATLYVGEAAGVWESPY